MTNLQTRGSAPTARRVRGPAYAAITECLRIQTTARPLPLLGRLFGQNPILPDARSWYLGAMGEIHVAKVLSNLSTDWTVLRAIEPAAEPSDLVVGPAGAFLVATRNHSRQRVWLGDDQLLVNGHRTNHLDDARHEARLAARVLGLPVTAVLAIVDPATLAITEPPRGVEVIAATQLESFLRRRKPRLTDAAVSEMLVMAEVSGTWSADVVDETLRYETRFARLKAEVDAAAHRRRAWLVAAAIVVTSLIVAGAVLAK
ncbi:MAG: hypothetical protein KF761_00395 [Salinibacterium sp.]|nr:hypothetical protein [Salinibacterium sp.]